MLDKIVNAFGRFIPEGCINYDKETGLYVTIRWDGELVECKTREEAEKVYLE